MPVSLEFLRGALGVLGIFFAHMAGRALVDYRRARVRQSRLIAWVIRAMVCAVAMIFPRRAVDIIALVVWILAAAAFAAGMWVSNRAKKEEDLTKVIFPEDDD
jgi:hypothetical protein